MHDEKYTETETETTYQTFGGQFRLIAQYTGREVDEVDRVLGGDVRVDVLVEELENQRDAVGEHEVLTCVLKLKHRKRGSLCCALCAD